MSWKLAHNSAYANMAPRIVASVFDWALLLLPQSYVLWRLAQVPSLEELVVQGITLLAVVIFPMSFVSIFYSVYALSHYGKTLGKAIVGIEVTDEHKKFLTWKMAFFRELMAKAVNYVILGLGYFSVLFDDKHRGWHDHLAGTYVHKHQSRTIEGLAAVIGLLIVHGFIVFQAVQALMNNQALITQFQNLFSSV